MAKSGGSLTAAPLDEDFVKALKDRVHKNPNDLDGLVALGVALLSRDEPDKALECFHRVTRKDPTYPGIWRFKARAFEALDDAENAELCQQRGSDKFS